MSLFVKNILFCQATWLYQSAGNSGIALVMKFLR